MVMIPVDITLRATIGTVQPLLATTGICMPRSMLAIVWGFGIFIEGANPRQHACCNASYGRAKKVSSTCPDCSGSRTATHHSHTNANCKTDWRQTLGICVSQRVVPHIGEATPSPIQPSWITLRVSSCAWIVLPEVVVELPGLRVRVLNRKPQVERSGKQRRFQRRCPRHVQHPPPAGCCQRHCRATATPVCSCRPSPAVAWPSGPGGSRRTGRSCACRSGWPSCTTLVNTRRPCVVQMGGVHSSLEVACR